MEKQELIKIAASLARPFTPTVDCISGDVAAALVTAAGHVFTGVFVDTACSLGFCAGARGGRGNAQGPRVRCPDDRRSEQGWNHLATMWSLPRIALASRRPQPDNTGDSRCRTGLG